MNHEDYKKRISEAKKREKERSITLRELLMAMEPSELLPDEWEVWDNFKNRSVFRIRLCFMAEEETWIEAYRDHIILIPWYDCKVYGFNASDEKFVLDVWMKYEEYIKVLLGRDGSGRKKEDKP